MDNPPSSPRNFTLSLLPWAVAAGALVLYLATLASWVTLPSLGLTAQVLGWDWWNPKVGRPLYHLLTLPVKALPAGMQLFALNACAAACAALTLALLARSVALLPQDRTRDQRARLKDETGLLALPVNWLPPLLAVLACGLQLSFWEHATAATGEALDLLLFAAAIWCLLEFRQGRDDKWLARFALACGLGFANNWAMVGFAPCFFVALIWIRGSAKLDFQKLKGPAGAMALLLLLLAVANFFAQPAITPASVVVVLLLMVLIPLSALYLDKAIIWGGAGLLVYLFNPLTASPEFGFGFTDYLTAELGAQKNNLLFNPKGRVLMLSAATLLPLGLIGIRWSSGFGDVSAAGSLLSNLLFRLMHALFLGGCVFMTLDQAFSPRALGYGQAMLTFYYLGALVIGYCAGYFLLLCGATEQKAWQKPGPLGKALNVACVGVICLGVLALPGWLVMKNLPSVRTQNGPDVREFATQLARGLPGQGALALSESPVHLLLVAGYFHGQSSPHILLDGRMLQLLRYHRQLARRHPGRWPDPGATPDTQIIPPMTVAGFLGMQTASNHVFTLHPPHATMYLENLYPEPMGLVNELRRYETNEMVPPAISSATRARMADWWKQNTRMGQAGDPAAPLQMAPDSQAIRAFKSAAANDQGVLAQRSGGTTNAQVFFQIATQLNPSNLVATLNRDFNEALRTGKPSASDPGKIAQELLAVHQTWPAVLARDGTPDEPAFCFALGQLYRQGGLPRQAIIEFVRATELAPTNHLAHLLLAETFIARGVPDRAKAALDAARARPELSAGLAASEAAILRLDALILSQKGSTTEAEQALQEALKKFPGDLPLLDSLTEIYLLSRRFTNALVVTEAALKAAPAYPRALVNKGGILIQLKQFEAALAPLDKLIELQPGHPVAHLNRAMALMNLKRFDDAAKDYRKLIELAPTTHNGHFGLGEIAWQNKRPDEARKHYEAGLKFAPADAPETKLVKQRLKELSGGK